MTFVRVLGTIGRAFIALGVFTLLFAVYQLWGTGLLEARAQGRLENEFDDNLAEIEALAEELDIEFEAAELVLPDDPSSPAIPVGLNEGAEPATTIEDMSIFELKPDLLWRDQGNPIGVITIPDIGVAKHIVEGVGVDDLRKGPGHYPGTPLPGMPGNAAIAGHRTTYGAPFNRIDELTPGDSIFAVTPQGNFEYRVIEQPNGKGHFIVSPDRIDVLEQSVFEHPNRLTLTACHPKFSAAQRIIVVAELVSEPAQYIARPDDDLDAAPADDLDQGLVGEEGLPGDPDLEDGGGDGSADGQAEEPAPGSTPTVAVEPDEPAEEEPSGDDPAAAPVAPDRGEPDAFQQPTDGQDFGEGLEGDRGAIMPAVLWGLAAAAIWAAAAFLGRRWKKWPMYVIALAPFAVTLFVCYVHIDQALPSY